MAQRTKHVTDVTIYRAERGRVSSFGNPSWVLHTSAGRFTTKANASLGYAVENLIAPTQTAPKPWQVIGDDDAQVTLVTTAAGRVFDILGADGNRIG